MEMELVHVEGNEYKIVHGGVEIASVYTTKDCYAFDIELALKQFEKED